MSNIYELPMLSLLERRDTIMSQRNSDKWFSHIVELCGVPWGMSANFTVNDDNIMSINDLKFITSKTDDDIIDKFFDAEDILYSKTVIVVFFGESILLQIFKIINIGAMLA